MSIRPYFVTVSLLLLSSLVITACPPKPAYVDVSVADARDLWIDGVFTLDVRTTGEFDAGHIPGATNIPVGELEQRLGELAGLENEKILVYCGSGGRSATASGILVDAAYTKVHNMLGGFNAWTAAGYETETK